MGRLKPNTKRANNAILIVWITMSMAMIELIAGIIQYRFLLQIKSGITISTDVSYIICVIAIYARLFFYIAWIISGITFIKWFRRAYYNLHQKVNHLSHFEWWAAAAWFIPILNLFVPCKIMVEMYKRTQKLLDHFHIETPRKLKLTYVGLWWTLLIILAIIFSENQGNYWLGDTIENASVLENIMTSSLINIIAGVLQIPLAIVTVKMIKRYAAVEPLLKDADGVGPKPMEETNTDSVI